MVNNPKIYLSQLYKACSTKILVKIELKMRACEKSTENLQILAKKGRLKTLAGYPRSQLQQAARGFPSFFKTKVEVVSTFAVLTPATPASVPAYFRVSACDGPQD